MRPEDVTLSEYARHLCEKHAVAEADIQQARAGTSACSERTYLLDCDGRLQDGRGALLRCNLAKPRHIVTWRPDRPV